MCAVYKQKWPFIKYTIVIYIECVYSRASASENPSEDNFKRIGLKKFIDTLEHICYGLNGVRKR